MRRDEVRLATGCGSAGLTAGPRPSRNWLPPRGRWGTSPARPGASTPRRPSPRHPEVRTSSKPPSAGACALSLRRRRCRITFRDFRESFSQGAESVREIFGGEPRRWWYRAHVMRPSPVSSRKRAAPSGTHSSGSGLEGPWVPALQRSRASGRDDSGERRVRRRAAPLRLHPLHLCHADRRGE